jgi:hypothetical protein
MRYKVEKRIETSSWIVMLLLLIIFVPRHRLREAQVTFFFKHLITWLFGLLVVEKGFIRYPYRLFFKKATKTSFTFEYFVYPSLCVLFNLYYPEDRSKIYKTVYYIAHSLLITGFEFIALKYTRLISYNGWKWYWTFSTIYFSYFLSRMYHCWFYKKPPFHQKKVIE